jgi:hypothetical protein
MAPTPQSKAHVEHGSGFMAHRGTRHKGDEERVHFEGHSKQEWKTRLGEHRRVDQGFGRAAVGRFFDMRPPMTPPVQEARTKPRRQNDKEEKGPRARFDRTVRLKSTPYPIEVSTRHRRVA